MGSGPYGHHPVAIATSGGRLKVCFIDEAGDLGALGNPPRPNDQPVLVIAGLFLDTASLQGLTLDFLKLKKQYFPGLPYRSNQFLDGILAEIKGADIRRNATRGTGRQKRHATGFLDRIMGLLQRYDAKLVARIWVKGVGAPFDPTPVYTSSIQGICSYFDHFLGQIDDSGICIADGRQQFQNVRVSHSVFTQKFAVEPRYRQILELPTFGHSDNHTGLQLCDIVCSGLLYPIACFAYCTGHVANAHVQPRAADLRQRYGTQLKALQYRYADPTRGNRYQGGLVVADGIGRQGGSRMFR